MLRLVASAAVLVAFGGMAACASPAADGPPATDPGQTAAAAAQPQPTTIRVLAASQIVGRQLRDPQGGDAGSINSLVIDTHTGVVDFVLVGSSGSFNAGNGVIAVPWPALQPPGSGSGPIDTKVSSDTIARSPHIDPTRVYELSQPGQRARIYGYYGYGYPRQYGDAYGLGLMGANGRSGRYGPNFVGQAREDARAFQNPGHPNNAQPNVGQSQSGGAAQQGTVNATTTQQTRQNGAATGSALVVTRDAVVSTLDQRGTTSANALQNASVDARDGEDIGDIDEVMIDVDRGEVAYVLLSRGGFLGLNQRWYVLPVEALVPAPYQGGYRLTVDAQTLLREPAFQGNRQDLPTRVSASQLASLYRQFGMQPYWEQGNQVRQSSNQSNNQSAGHR